MGKDTIAESNKLSLNPKTHTVEGKNQYPQLSLTTRMCHGKRAPTRVHKYMHTYNIHAITYNLKNQQYML